MKCSLGISNFLEEIEEISNFLELEESGENH